jgi:hypothetical protein
MINRDCTHGGQTHACEICEIERLTLKLSFAIKIIADFTHHSAFCSCVRSTRSGRLTYPPVAMENCNCGLTARWKELTE